MPKIIPFIPPQKEPERELLCFCHECVNFLFKLREDNKIVCDKCGAVVGEWKH